MDIKKAIDYLKYNDSRLSVVIDSIGELSIKSYSDSFRFLVGEIIEQMLSKKSRKVIEGRVSDLCDGHICIQNVLKHRIQEFRSVGLSNSKSSCIINLAEAVQKGELNFKDLEDRKDEEVISILCSYKGIGIWTAKMYLIFFLNRLDVLPYEDTAFLQAYKWLYEADETTKKDIEKNSKKWKPYTSIAARYLYIALDSGYTKYNIREFLLSKGYDFTSRLRR